MKTTNERTPNSEVQKLIKEVKTGQRRLSASEFKRLPKQVQNLYVQVLAGLSGLNDEEFGWLPAKQKKKYKNNRIKQFEMQLLEEKEFRFPEHKFSQLSVTDKRILVKIMADNSIPLPKEKSYQEYYQIWYQTKNKEAIKKRLSDNRNDPEYLKKVSEKRKEKTNSKRKWFSRIYRKTILKFVFRINPFRHKK